MSILNDMLNDGMIGEPERLDYVISRHERLQARVNQLVELLAAKGLITTQERAAFESPEDGALQPPSGGQVGVE